MVKVEQLELTDMEVVLITVESVVSLSSFLLQQLAVAVVETHLLMVIREDVVVEAGIAIMVAQAQQAKAMQEETIQLDQVLEVAVLDPQVLILQVEGLQTSSAVMADSATVAPQPLSFWTASNTVEVAAVVDQETQVRTLQEASDIKEVVMADVATMTPQVSALMRPTVQVVVVEVVVTTTAAVLDPPVAQEVQVL
jgi:hypothetical protein